VRYTISRVFFQDISENSHNDQFSLSDSGIPSSNCAREPAGGQRRGAERHRRSWRSFVLQSSASGRGTTGWLPFPIAAEKVPAEYRRAAERKAEERENGATTCCVRDEPCSRPEGSEGENRQTRGEHPRLSVPRKGEVESSGFETRAIDPSGGKSAPERSKARCGTPINRGDPQKRVVTDFRCQRGSRAARWRGLRIRLISAKGNHLSVIRQISGGERRRVKVNGSPHQPSFSVLRLPLRHSVQEASNNRGVRARSVIGAL